MELWMGRKQVSAMMVLNALVPGRGPLQELILLFLYQKRITKFCNSNGSETYSWTTRTNRKLGSMGSRLPINEYIFWTV